MLVRIKSTGWTSSSSFTSYNAAVPFCSNNAFIDTCLIDIYNRYSLHVICRDTSVYTGEGGKDMKVKSTQFCSPCSFAIRAHCVSSSYAIPNMNIIRIVVVSVRRKEGRGTHRQTHKHLEL